MDKELFTCPNCNLDRTTPFPVSDETGDTYCPDCNWSISYDNDDEFQYNAMRSEEIRNINNRN